MEYVIDESLKNNLEINYPDNMPSCKIYGDCLYEAKSKFKISIDEIREKFGGYTNKEWLEVLSS